MPVPYATQITLYSGVPWDNTYTDVRLFSSKSAISIPGTVLASFSNASYQRVNSSVASPRVSYSMRVPMAADSLYLCNYMRFNNANKWFYCFVSKVNFINTNNTELIYEIDEFTTWFYDCTLRPSYVVREHSATDGAGENLVPEPVSSLEFIEKESSVSSWLLTDPRVIMLTSGPHDSSDITPGGLQNNIYFPLSVTGPTTADIANFNIQQYSSNGTQDKIIHISTVMTDNGVIPTNDTLNIVEPTSIDGYVPRNNKLFTAQFNKCKLCSTNGDSVELAYEIFKPTYTAQIYVGAPPNYEAVLVPYYGGYLNYSYAITTNLGIESPWLGDNYSTYTNTTRQEKFLTNILNTLAGMTTGAVMGAMHGAAGGGPGIAAGAVAGAAGPLIGGAAGGIAQVAIDDYTAQRITPTYHGGVTANMNFRLERVGFYVVQKCIIREQAKRIDKYFDMFGYAVNTPKTPNCTGRQYFNYVQTRGCVLTGSIPDPSMKILKSIFDSGVRLWHNNNVGQYDPESGNPIA